MRRTATAVAVAAALCFPAHAAAGPYRVSIVVEPTYTFCLSGPACTSSGQTSFAVEYKPIVTKKLDLRFKFSRAYERSTEDPGLDDINVTSDQRYQRAADTLSAQLRFFDADGYERQEPRLGYAFQYPLGGSNGHHTLYGSDTLFFGARIRRGTESPAHLFRVALKVSKDAYEPAGVSPQTFLQASAYATFPLEPSGMWRAEAGYTVQQQLATPYGFSWNSARYTASLTHDFSSAIRAYLRLETSETTNLIAGMKITF